MPADDRHQFVWWSGGISGTDNPVTFTMPVFGSVSVTASFSLSPPDIHSVWPWWSLGSAAVGSTVYSDISISNTGGQTLIVVSMSFTGAHASEFFIANATQSFNLTSGAVNIGAHSDKTFAVRNAGTGILNVSVTSLRGLHPSEFAIQGGGGSFQLDEGQSRDITVRFSPTGTGVKKALLSLNSDDPDENPFNVDMLGTGTADPVETRPDIDVSPASLNISNSGTLDLVIRNTGTSDLTFGILENNLLVNSGFESGFEPWIEEDHVNAGSIVRDSSQHHSGSWSAKCTGDQLVNEWELQLKQCGFQVTDPVEKDDQAGVMN